LLGGGNSDSLSNYYIGTNSENFGGNYTKLDLAWHTGIRMGAQPQYGGVRIFDSEDFGTVLFSVGTSGTGVVVSNTLTVTGGNIVLGGISGRIQGVVTVISGSDATSKTYVDSAISTAGGAFLPKAGGVMSGKIGRSTAIVGFLEGSYNNVGSNDTNSNPIYTIGSSYNPASTTLSNMYGIGYTHTNASFIGLTGATGWGMYVASDGDARVWLDGGSGNISHSGDLYVGGGDIVLAGTGRIQGIDTVSATTDAANKAYVDTKLPIANPTFTGTLTGPAATITTVTGALVGNVTGNVSGSSGSTTGNAATVTNGVYTIGNQTIAGTKTFSSTIAGSISGNAVTAGGLAVGTGVNNSANQIVRTQANGYCDFGWINSVSGVTTATITRITASNDAYLRYVTPATFRSQVIAPYFAPIGTVSGVTSVNFTTDGTALNVVSNTISTSGTMTGIWQGTASEYVNGLGDRVAFPTIPQGDITNVSTTSPITGGGSSGSVTIAHAASGVTAGTYTVATVTVDATGHVTSASTNTVSASESINTIAQRSSSGYLFASYFNGSGTFSTSGATSGMGRFTGTNGTDTYGRSYTAAAARTLLNVANGATNVTNNNQLTNGAGYTTNTGTITGSGVANQLTQWNSSTGIINTKITSTAGLYNFNNYTATAVATTGTLSAIQNAQALSQDTLANLCVDPSGNVVRGSQEGSWTFTKAQLDALTTSTTSGTTLIAAPGANKAVIVEESNWMIKYSGADSMSTTQAYEIRQAIWTNTSASVARLPSTKINEVMDSAQGTPTNPSYGFYSRDVPDFNNDARTYNCNKATFLTRLNSNATPGKLISVTIKLKYRLFDATTF